MNEGQVSTSDDFRAATARLHATAAWVTGAFGAIAALLIGTADWSFTDGSVATAFGRLAAVGVALTATALTIDAAAKVFVDRYVTLADLSRDLRGALADAEFAGALSRMEKRRGATANDDTLRADSPESDIYQAGIDLKKLLTAERLESVENERLLRQVTSNHPVLGELSRVGPETFGSVAESLEVFQNRLEAANEALQRADPSNLPNALEWWRVVDSAVERTLSAANYFETRERFCRGRRKLIGSVPVILGAVIIGLMFRPSESEPSPSPAEMRVTNGRGAVLYAYPSKASVALGTIDPGAQVGVTCRYRDVSAQWYRNSDGDWLFDEDVSLGFLADEPPFCER